MKVSAKKRVIRIEYLRVILWAVPGAMALLGAVFTLYENNLHAGETFWPWPTVVGLLVLAIIGPILAWISLHQAIRTAEALLASEKELTRRNEELVRLNSLSFSSSRSLDLHETLSTALEQTIQVMDAQAGMIFLYNGNHRDLHLTAHQGVSESMVQQEAVLTPGRCLCGQAVETRRVLFAPDVPQDHRCTMNLCLCEGFRSVACAPLETKGQLVGLLQLASPQMGHFSEHQQDFLSAMARQMSVSIENARLYDTVRSLNVELEQRVNQRTQDLETARWKLAEKARQLQRLLSDSYRVQEDTQSRIAHDMHDGVTQVIVGALYETQAARAALADDPERAAESLARAQQLLSDMEAEIRRVIYDLHPPVLDQMGLVVALKRLSNTFAQTFSVECEIEISGAPRRLEKRVEIAIYRILQAALHNVVHHAQARHVRVSFDFQPEFLQVSVQDDGVGFIPQEVMNTPGEHLGLIGMRERAESLGATLQVTSTPGKGTCIQLRLAVTE